MTQTHILMDESSIQSLVQSASQAIFARYPNPKSLLIMGMISRGVPLSQRLAAHLSHLYQTEIEIGTLDATLYRDDFHYRKTLHQPLQSVSNLCRSIEKRDIILVDDVLYTGRSVRAAMDALNDMGRAASIRLFVLVDRGCRELPIAPDFTGLTLDTHLDQAVKVSLKPIDSMDLIELIELKGEN